MAKFQFKLDAVLKVRKVTEDKALQEMALYQSKFQAAIQVKKDLISLRDKTLVAREELSNVSCTPVDYQILHTRLLGIQKEMLRADQSIVRTRRFLEQAIRAYIKARKEKLMIERLQEKAFADWKIEQSKLEQKRIDDMISSRHAVEHGLLDKESA